MSNKALKLTAVITAAVLSVSFCAGQKANAKEFIDNGDFKYVVSDDGKTAELVQYSGSSLYIAVPPQVENYDVTSIGPAAFKDNTMIKELDVSNKVKYIDVGAFEGCTALSKIQIPGNVQNIGDSAFSGCTSLTDISIDDGVKEIGKYAFSECKSIVTVKLPNSLDTIGDYAFLNCTSLENPGIPKALRYFGGYALENTKWLNSQKEEFVTIGDGILVKYTGDSTIKSIPKKIKTVGSYAFAGNTKITEVMIPSTVSTIDNSAFEGCTSLNDIYIPDSVEKIGEKVFYGCTNLKSVDIPSGISVLNNYTFAQSGLEFVKISQNVAVINEGAFESCESLKTVEISNGVKKIGERAFKDCKSVKRFVFPMSVQEIEKNAFEGCTSLLRVEFNGDTELKNSSFSECPNLTAAVFYKNPKKLEDNAFNQVPELVIYSDNNMYLDEYARNNGKAGDNIKNLAVFDDSIQIESRDKEENSEQGFSSGYTFVTIMIIIIDLALVLLFGAYIIFIEPERSRKARQKAVAKAARQKLSAENGRPLNRQRRTNTGNPDIRRNPVQSPQRANDEGVTYARQIPKNKSRSSVKRVRSDEDVTYVSSPSKRSRPAPPRRRTNEEDVVYVSAPHPRPRPQRPTRSVSQNKQRPTAQKRPSDSELDKTIVFRVPKDRK